VATRVYFEEGKSSVFAAAIDWPGWCRRAKSRDAALEALLDYQGRYAAVLSMPFKPGTFEVVGAVPGNATRTSVLRTGTRRGTMRQLLLKT